MNLIPDNPIWEYQVIHLNVNEAASPAQQAGAAADPAPDPAAGQAAQPGLGVFSKAYLEHEFPNFYAQPHPETPPTPTQPASVHPAQQLQGFLNRCGEQGWLLIGVFPIGKLQMMIMRRQRPRVTVPPAPPEPGNALLTSILNRLEALEEGSDRSLTTAQAAQALGFSSTSPLLTALRRSDQSDGLIAQGANGKTAVYLGLGLPASGGRRCRLWRVLPSPDRSMRAG